MSSSSLLSAGRAVDGDWNSAIHDGTGEFPSLSSLSGAAGLDRGLSPKGTSSSLPDIAHAGQQAVVYRKSQARCEVVTLNFI